MARDRIPVKRPIVGALIPTRLRFTIRELLPSQCFGNTWRRHLKIGM